MQNETLWSNIQSNETDTSLAKKTENNGKTHTLNKLQIKEYEHGSQMNNDAIRDDKTATLPLTVKGLRRFMNNPTRVAQCPSIKEAQVKEIGEAITT